MLRTYSVPRELPGIQPRHLAHQQASCHIECGEWLPRSSIGTKEAQAQQVNRNLKKLSNDLGVISVFSETLA
jgi:hypothetical protein